MSGTGPLHGVGESVDAVVVGAGPNGLVAANLLVDAGWSVVVLEAQDTLGGAVRSDRELHPDYVQDTFSAFYPLAAASGAIRSLHLEDHGLAWSHAPAVLGHAFADGGWALQDRDRELTARWMEDEQPGDGEAWLRLCEQWDRVGGSVVDALLSPFPPVRAGLRGLTQLPSAGPGLVADLLRSVIGLGDHRFRGRAPKVLLAGNAGHADLPLDGIGSGVFALMLTMTGQQHGFPVPVGGAGELTQALARRFEAAGGEIRLGTPVVGLDLRDGRVRTVRTAGGPTYDARRAVVASVVATELYGDLVQQGDLPARVRWGMKRFRLDPSTVKVDWALSGPVPWASRPAKAPGTVHVADDRDQLVEATAQVAAGMVPDKPFLLTGQMTTSDPTRSPAGTESLWAYTHVPQPAEHRGDVAGELTGRWDHDDLERFGDRVQQRLERLAPGFGSRVVARRVLGPHQLEERDANLVGGAINGGTSRIGQELVLRPVPGLGRAESGVPGLYLASASAHPGGGVHGAPGANAARAALAHHRVRRAVPWIS
ncbi:Phytoene dehydrogenase-related protein [Nocardioides scoriae]|uniref:Pyridine nucleotide-disulfide oxidoreductase domain-containing protein 2 n=1 Tax=Nocardioides scoriae TaxID=642780 RepID=A0A1H1WRS0_9ACTN|nr:NAD(P)/FAD-dependent oxidoreductase [Nocardioides scoriae]SDS99833.1 Phytoene dehydrogenase-related protein [Nocardioides scoriae]